MENRITLYSNSVDYSIGVKHFNEQCTRITYLWQYWDSLSYVSTGERKATHAKYQIQQGKIISQNRTRNHWIISHHKIKVPKDWSKVKRIWNRHFEYSRSKGAVTKRWGHEPRRWAFNWALSIGSFYLASYRSVSYWFNRHFGNANQFCSIILFILKFLLLWTMFEFELKSANLSQSFLFFKWYRN